MRPNVNPALWNLPPVKGRCHNTCGLGDFRTARGAPASPPDHRCVLMDQQHPPEACEFGGRCLRAQLPVGDFTLPEQATGEGGVPGTAPTSASK